MRRTTASRSRPADHDWAMLKEKRDAYVLRLNGIYEGNLAKRGVTLIRGRAAFRGRPDRGGRRRLARRRRTS